MDERPSWEASRVIGESEEQRHRISLARKLCLRIVGSDAAAEVDRPHSLDAAAKNRRFVPADDSCYIGRPKHPSGRPAASRPPNSAAQRELAERASNRRSDEPAGADRRLRSRCPEAVITRPGPNREVHYDLDKLLHSGSSPCMFGYLVHPQVRWVGTYNGGRRSWIIHWPTN